MQATPNFACRLDQEVFDLINQVRLRPASIINDLEQMKKRYHDNLYKVDGQTTVRTKEGVKAVNDAIDYLN